MTVHDSRQQHRSGHGPAWWTVSAWASLGLLVLAGLAGAVGIG
ncbi:molybdopterin oxidoreductase [Pengzhenrongella frigida]|uniref:Molybdopterin oxidoreductase n=1 Tax=Pengzhenrongella frigida TaxID=1259133 RepID=A0A4Q5N1H8_9MICO|nr:molybdopterin oxidoreductase [Cellulomonas sp. HLT2-17]RYV52032.1 molybdopterin oxidoreductase [Cellulomonas sp. HLT2-17]